MAIPENATSVKYSIYGSSNMDEIAIQFEVSLTTSPALADTAAQATADAAVAHLRSTLPNVTASRAYAVSDPGGTWPTAATTTAAAAPEPAASTETSGEA